MNIFNTAKNTEVKDGVSCMQAGNATISGNAYSVLVQENLETSKKSIYFSSVEKNDVGLSHIIDVAVGTDLTVSELIDLARKEEIALNDKEDVSSYF